MKTTGSPAYLAEFACPGNEMQALYEMKMRYLKPVNQPLVLISQVQRSGGTLLSQLFDSHPACFVHPHEIYVGHPHKWIWPDLRLDGTPSDWFETLFEEYNLVFFRKGYEKTAFGADRIRGEFPFVLPPGLQRHIFMRLASGTEIRSRRDILDCYMTSYFNAWLDYHGGFGGKKWIVGFVPRLSMFPDSVRSCFDDYPHGRMISIIRDPATWYASACRQRPEEYSPVEKAIAIWRNSAVAMLRNKERYGRRVRIISFEKLLGSTRESMALLAGWLGIPPCDSLYTPTFQGLPIRANSSFQDATTEVSRSPLRRMPAAWHETRYIEKIAGPVYREVLATADDAVVPAPNSATQRRLKAS